MTRACARVREHLGAYVDGELGAADRLYVSRHLPDCSSCAEELQDIRELGEALRTSVGPPPVNLVNLQGLASGIISRTRAEDAQSWRAMLTRASEDWHWAIVAGGSLVSAAASILLVAAICGLGPRPDHEDSLAAMLTNLQTPVGTLFLVAAPAGPDQVPVLMQFDNGAANSSSDTAAVPAGFFSPNGSDLALELSQAVVGPDGRLTDLRLLSRPRRQEAEALLDRIQLLGAAPSVSWSGRRLSIQKLGFVTNTNVTGKAL